MEKKSSKNPSLRVIDIIHGRSILIIEIKSLEGNCLIFIQIYIVDEEFLLDSKLRNVFSCLFLYSFVVENKRITS